MSLPQSSKATPIRIGSRSSQLALIQTHHVVDQLKVVHGQCEFEIHSMKTIGDHILDKPLAQIGSKALFTKELEDALLNDEVDFIVHSIKDLPTTLPDGCCIGAVLQREDPSDALVVKSGHQATDHVVNLLKNPSHDGGDCSSQTSHIPPITIGTSSLRRVAQLKQLDRGIEVADVRGNINTRLAKLDDPDGIYSALLLASAGLTRAGYEQRISHRLNVNWFYAVGQGALAVECRTDDEAILRYLSPLVDVKSTCECIAERSLMRTLEGGCSVPIGTQCSWNSDHEMNLSGIVLSLDGTRSVRDNVTASLCEPTGDDDRLIFAGIKYVELSHADAHVKPLYVNAFKLGTTLANRLIGRGANDILNEIKLSK